MICLDVVPLHHAPASHGRHRLTPLARLRKFPIIVITVIETGRPGMSPASQRVADPPVTVEETA